MIKRFVIAAVLAAALSSSPVAAAGNAQSGFTVGDCLSDGFYGNEPNMADGTAGGPAEQTPGSNGGNVVATQSPGPFKTLPDGTVVRGRSVGDVQQLGFSIPEICRTLTSGG